jgi:ferritin
MQGDLRGRARLCCTKRWLQNANVAILLPNEAARRRIVVLNDRMQKALNDQINAEMYSAYLYLAMAAHFEHKGLQGLANWMEIQYQEETAHAMKFYRYVIDRGGRAVLAAIAAPPNEWATPLAAFEGVLEHEHHVTGLINKLADLAVELKDHATRGMLDWFIAEQVEEEATAEAIINKLKLLGETGPGLFMLDQELASRVFTPPAASTTA